MEAEDSGSHKGPKLAPYNPTNMDAVHIALDMLELSENDVLYDLGCGDGRLLIEVESITQCIDTRLLNNCIGL